MGCMYTLRSVSSNIQSPFIIINLCPPCPPIIVKILYLIKYVRFLPVSLAGGWWCLCFPRNCAVLCGGEMWSR